MNRTVATYLILASAFLAAPGSLVAHPHGGEGGLPHEILHFFLGGGHLLPAVAAAALAALAAGIALAAVSLARRPGEQARVEARVEAEPVRKRIQI